MDCNRLHGAEESLRVWSIRMSVRASFPKAQLPQTHYFITFARGEQLRCFALRPVALFSILALFPLFALIYLGATMTLLLRDDMISALMSR